MEQICGICGYLFEADDEYPMACRDCAPRRPASWSEGDLGKKFDQDKLRVDLVPVEGVEAAARVLTFGAKKYGDRNWELGMKHSRLYGAVLRHLFAHWRGETYDQETGYPHLHHAVCACMMLQTLFDRGHGTDDRPLEGKDE